MLNDVYCDADNKHRTLLLRLDLSAAFDTIHHHPTQIRRLENSFGIVGVHGSVVVPLIYEGATAVRLMRRL